MCGWVSKQKYDSTVELSGCLICALLYYVCVCNSFLSVFKMLCMIFGYCDTCIFSHTFHFSEER